MTRAPESTISRAAVFAGTPGQILLQEFPLPALKPGEILVQVAGCTLCGSDLHSIHARRKVPIPTILGHEIVGRIVAMEDAAPRRDLAGQLLDVGDLVTWAVVAHCGECFFCQRDLPQKCLQAVKYGHEAIKPQQELTGGLAEHCVLVRGTSIVKLPEQIPLSVVCPASCATATVAAALGAAVVLPACDVSTRDVPRRDPQSRTVCLVGAGMLGLTACAMARARGAELVACIDPIAARRELALRFGATRAVSPDDAAGLLSIEGLARGFDVIIELSGNPAGFETAWPLLRTGGTLVLVGAVYPASPVGLAMEDVVRRQLTIRGVHNYAPQHLCEAVEFLTANHTRYPFDELVTRWFPLDEVSEAVRYAGESGVIRVGVEPVISR